MIASRPSVGGTLRLMSIELALHAGGGCLRRRDLVTDGSGSRGLALLEGSGRVVKAGRGLYALPGTPADVVAARAAGGLVTCVSLAAHLGLPMLEPPEAPHVAVPGNRGAPTSRSLPPGTVIHWDSSVTARSVTRTGTAPIASTPEALLHVMSCLPRRDAVALIDSALNRSHCTLAQLQALRPRSGRLRFDQVLRAVDGRSQSLPESFLRLALISAGLRAEPQVVLLGVGQVDLLVERLLVVEVDGFAYHSGRREFREDRRRDRVAGTLDIPVLRFVFEDAVHFSDRSVLEVTEVLDRLKRRGARPVSEDLILRSA